jgi:hypothetical protein
MVMSTSSPSSPIDARDNNIPTNSGNIWSSAAEFVWGTLSTITNTMSAQASFVGQKLRAQQSPFEELADLQQAWREREPVLSWTTDKTEGIDLEGIDWQSYDPPAALREMPDVNSQILVDIVEQSLENVRTRATEEYRQRRDEEERRLAEETEARKAKRAEDLFLPIIIVEDEPDLGSDEVVDSEKASDPLTEAARALSRIRAQALQELTKSKKRSLLISSHAKSSKLLTRILRRNVDNLDPENSDADSNAWQALRDKLRESSNDNAGSGNVTIEESNDVVRQSRLIHEEPEQEELVYGNQNENHPT